MTNQEDPDKEPYLDKREVNRLLNIIGDTENVDYFLNKKTMEKQIKISLETAREMYRDLNMCPSTHLRNLLEDNFTKEELEGKKGFTWENSFSRGGFYITTLANIEDTDNGLEVDCKHKNVFKTREQAESALAFAQLSHIIPMYNEGKTPLKNEGGVAVIYVVAPSKKSLCVLGLCNVDTWENLYFLTKEDALMSLQLNIELWKQYWMIK